MSKPNRGQEANGSFVLSWQEERRARLGEGISRPYAKQRTRTFELRIQPAAGRPMKVWLPAPDKKTALVYAMNRWPDATAEVVA